MTKSSFIKVLEVSCEPQQLALRLTKNTFEKGVGMMVILVSCLANSKYRLFNKYVTSSVSKYHNDEETSKAASWSVLPS